MIIVNALLLGLLQGILEFFPISSTGCITITSVILKTQVSLFTLSLLHLGTFLAVFIYFFRDIKKCIVETFGMIKDIFKNAGIYVKATTDTQDLGYRRIVCNNYRKISLMVLISTGITIVAGLILAGPMEKYTGNIMVTGIGFLVSAMVLFVASMSGKGKKVPGDITHKDAFIMGVMESISLVNGVSLLGTTYSTGKMLGFTNKLNKTLCFLLLVPASLGSFIVEMIRACSVSSTLDLLIGLMSLVISFMVGFVVIKAAVKVMGKISLGIFALVSAALGILSLILYYI